MISSRLLWFGRIAIRGCCTDKMLEKGDRAGTDVESRHGALSCYYNSDHFQIRSFLQLPCAVLVLLRRVISDRYKPEPQSVGKRSTCEVLPGN